MVNTCLNRLLVPIIVMLRTFLVGLVGSLKLILFAVIYIIGFGLEVLAYGHPTLINDMFWQIQTLVYSDPSWVMDFCTPTSVTYFKKQE